MMKLYPDLKVGGCAAPDGKLFLTVARGSKTYVVSREALLRDPNAQIKLLTSEGFVGGGRGLITQILEQAAGISDYPEREVLPNPGWNGSLIALPDGSMLGPLRTRKLSKKPLAAFHRHPNRYRRAGSRKKWAGEVAGPIAADDIAVFAVGLVLAPVIRTLISQPTMPLAFELINNRNNQHLKRFVLSVAGSMGEGLVTDPMKDLIAEPSRYIGNSRDLLLFVGETDGYLCGAADKKRVTAVRSLLFDHLLAQEGGEVNVSGGPAPSFVLIEKRPISEMLELGGEAAERLSEGLLTIHIPPVCPGEGSEGGPLSRATERSWSDASRKAADNHGKILKSFQVGLVEARSEHGLAKIQRNLDKRFNKFVKKARKEAGDIDCSDAILHRFALIATALWAANTMKAVSYDNHGESVLRVFEHHLGTRPTPVTAASILLDLYQRLDVRALDDIKESEIRENLESTSAFINTRTDGSRELWVLTDQKKTVFDWPTFSKMPDFSKWFCGKGEKDRHGSKRVIGGWKTARVLRFRLPRDV